MIRLFVGLGLPLDIKEKLIALKGGLPGARWTEARNLHLTLRFIGAIENGLAEEVHEELNTLRVACFELSLEGFGTFGKIASSSFWVGVEKAPGLLRLQNKIEGALRNQGLPAEGRKFTPHVTLARLKETPVPRVQEFLLQHAPFRAGPWEVDHFVLFRSRLGHGGSEYQALAEYPLS